MVYTRRRRVGEGLHRLEELPERVRRVRDAAMREGVGAGQVNELIVDYGQGRRRNTRRRRDAESYGDDEQRRGAQ